MCPPARAPSKTARLPGDRGVVPRVDIPAKLTGGEAYVQDMRLPGMLHARVVRRPSAGATLRTLDAAAVEACRAS